MKTLCTACLVSIAVAIYAVRYGQSFPLHVVARSWRWHYNKCQSHLLAVTDIVRGDDESDEEYFLRSELWVEDNLSFSSVDRVLEEKILHFSNDADDTSSIGLELSQEDDGSSDNNRQKYRPSTFSLDIAYNGSCFCGWQRQPIEILPSVQGVVEDALQPFFSKGSANVRVAGRTDSGVSALGQVARVKLNQNYNAADIKSTLYRAAEADSFTWRCWNVTLVSEKFHPTFQATSRSYMYFVDETMLQCLHPLSIHEIASTLNDMLQSLENEDLDYFAMSKAKLQSMNNTNCTLYRARVRVETNDSSLSDDNNTLVFELTGNRFLRKMIRILVNTCFLILVRHRNDKSIDCERTLKYIVLSRDRKQTAPPAPAQGLIFVGATFEAIR